jgi:hypothetical protein
VDDEPRSLPLYHSPRLLDDAREHLSALPA